ncbi:MAG: hypothetical protein IPH13_09550 [Planctomycetes bacterium]|nr:hypothetical protein [Planctomycetota bacterium]MCC7168923.1 hypothetical protein [Planctomycetota bacterium]
MNSTNPRRPHDDESPKPRAPERTPATPPRREPKHDELDLDLEEADEGDRLKEGFTGQER